MTKEETHYMKRIILQTKIEYLKKGFELSSSKIESYLTFVEASTTLETIVMKLQEELNRLEEDDTVCMDHD